MVLTARPRMLASLAVLSLLLAGLAACGGSHDGSSASGNYCADLSAGQSALRGFTANTLSTSGFDDLLTRVDGIRDEAPSAVKADWVTFDNALRSFQSALEGAGLSMSDVAKMQSGGMGDMSGSAMQRAMHAGSAVNSPAFLNAVHRIQVEAQSSCKLDFAG